MGAAYKSMLPFNIYTFFKNTFSSDEKGKRISGRKRDGDHPEAYGGFCKDQALPCPSHE